VEPEAERVPTGVGGASRIVPEEEVWLDEPEPKRKRKSKREVRQPPQGEKFEEKERESQEKSEEKQAEKGWDVNVEKGEIVVLTGSWGDRLSQFVWGGIAVWIGTVLLLEWPTAYILSGVGALFLGEVAVRQIMPEYHARPGLRLVAGAVLLAAGLGMGFSIGSLWALILIVIGASLLLNHLAE
jgi:hypothetical protein